MTAKNIGKRRTNKTLLVVLFTIFIIATVFFLWNNRTTTANITLDFSIFPGDSTRGVAFAVYAPYLTLSEIRKVSKAALQYEIPFTVFVVAQPESEIDDGLSMEPSVDLDGLKTALGESEYTIQDAGYVDTPYADLQYQSQEDLLGQSRKAYRKQGITVDGFFPPAFSYSYDTILAAENMKYDYIILPSNNESLPLHPRAAFGGKMNILIFPYRDQLVEDGLNIVFLDGNAAETIERIVSEESFAIMSLEGWSEQARAIESIGATMITDTRDLTSQVSLSDLKNGTKMVLESDLFLSSITSGNQTVDFFLEGTHYVVLLEEDMDNLILNWSLEKYK